MGALVRGFLQWLSRARRGAPTNVPIKRIHGVAEWFFRKKGRNEVERDPGWDEYFTSNRSTDESLVREAIQNSLDAHARVANLVDSAIVAFVKGRNLTQMANEWEGE